MPETDDDLTENKYGGREVKIKSDCNKQSSHYLDRLNNTVHISVTDVLPARQRLFFLSESTVFKLTTMGALGVSSKILISVNLLYCFRHPLFITAATLHAAP